MQKLDRITFDPHVMGGKPCVRGMRVTVGMIVGLVASGYSNAEILDAYPYLEEEDIRQSLSYAAWLKLLQQRRQSIHNLRVFVPQIVRFTTGKSS